MIIFACSFATLEPNEAGLVYNSVTQVLNKEKVYTGGRYLVGPGMTFMVFPLYAQNIDLDNQLVTSQSKQQFTISVSLQYKLLNTEKGEIVSIYNNYNNKLSALNSQLMSIAVQAIKETVCIMICQGLLHFHTIYLSDTAPLPPPYSPYRLLCSPLLHSTEGLLLEAGVQLTTSFSLLYNKTSPIHSAS